MDALNKFLSQYGGIIIYIPTIIFLVVILINVLKGLLRGFRKNLILTCLSLGSCIIAYLIFILVLRKPFFEKWVLNLYENFIGETLNKTLNVSESYTRIKEIVSAAIEAKINDEGARLVYGNFSPYVEALSECVLGIIYMIFTLILWFLIYLIIGRLIIYTFFLSERKYKNKIEAENEAAKQEALAREAAMASEQKDKAEESLEENATQTEDNQPATEENAVPEVTYIVKEYKKRRLLGGVVGAIKGMVLAFLVISVFGSIYYVSTGLKTDVYESGETVTVSYNGENYDLTEIYKFIYDYNEAPLNKAMNGMKIGGVPAYASVGNLFCKGTLKVSEDGIHTKIYPMNELANVMEIMHSGVQVLNKYNIVLSKDVLTELGELIDNNPEFVDDLYDVITSFGKTPLHRALGRTVTNHFAEMVVESGHSSKYFEAVFLGENAINVSDILTKNDIRQFINIASKAITVYNDYDSSKDIKDVIINKCNDVKTLTDELLKLSLFEDDNKSKLNACVSDLLELVFDNYNKLKDISLENINWFGNNGTGEIAKFIRSISNFLNSNILIYEGSTITFNFQRINALFEHEEDELSIMDELKESSALRRFLSSVLNDTNIGDSKLYIPSSCYDADGYIKANEYEAMFTSLQSIVLDIDFSAVENVEFSDIANTIVPEIVDNLKTNENLADYLTSSNVLTAMASKYIYDEFCETLGYNVPDYLNINDTNVENTIGNWLGQNGELYKLLKAINVIGEVEDISVENVLKLNDNQVDTICESGIVWYAVSDAIIESNETSDYFKIPTAAYESENLIKQAEIKAAIKAIIELEKNIENPNLDSLDSNMILANDINMDKILDSLIIWYSISTAMNETEGITIPKVSFVDNAATELYVKKDEIKNTITSLKLIGETDIENIVIDSSVLFTLSDDNIDVLLDSYVVWYETSKIFISNISSIPSSVEEVLLEQQFVSKSEIKAAKDALDLLNNSSIEGYHVNEDGVLSLSPNNHDTLLESYIVWNEISLKIKAASNVIVDIDAIDTIGSDDYIQKSEIKGLLSLLNGTGATSFDDVPTNPTSLVENGLTSIVANTIILRATVAKYVFYDNDKPIIENNGYTITTNYADNKSIITYTSEEVTSLIEGLAALGVTSIESGLSITSADFTNISSEKRSEILESYTLWVYVSDCLVSYADPTKLESHSIVRKSLLGYSTVSNYAVLKKDYLINYGS